MLSNALDIKEHTKPYLIVGPSPYSNLNSKCGYLQDQTLLDVIMDEMHRKILKRSMIKLLN